MLMVWFVILGMFLVVGLELMMMMIILVMVDVWLVGGLVLMILFISFGVDGEFVCLKWLNLVVVSFLIVLVYVSVEMLGILCCLGLVDMLIVILLFVFIDVLVVGLVLIMWFGGIVEFGFCKVWILKFWFCSVVMVLVED